MNAPDRQGPPNASPTGHDGARIKPGEVDEHACPHCQGAGQPDLPPDPTGASPTGSLEELLHIVTEIRDMLKTDRRELSGRARSRLALGRAGVISLTEAVERLPWGDGETQWMIDAGIAYKKGCRHYVFWGDVLDALKDGKGPLKPSENRDKKKPRRRNRGSTGASTASEVKASDLPRF